MGEGRSLVTHPEEVSAGEAVLGSSTSSPSSSAQLSPSDSSCCCSASSRDSCVHHRLLSATWTWQDQTQMGACYEGIFCNAYQEIRAHIPSSARHTNISCRQCEQKDATRTTTICCNQSPPDTLGFPHKD